MGSFIIQRTYLLYKDTFYYAEEWDRDYEGCVWDYEVVKKGLPDFGLPLGIRTKKSNEQKTLEILEKVNTFEEAVREFANNGILCFPDCDLLYELNIEKDYFTTVYPQEKGRRETAQIMKRLFGAINDSPIKLKQDWFIKVICPEFITLYNEKENAYKVLFIGKEIQSVYLDINGLHMEGDKFLNDIAPALCQAKGINNNMYIVTY